jgi:hypothetical protein
MGKLTRERKNEIGPLYQVLDPIYLVVGILEELKVSPASRS